MLRPNPPMGHSEASTYNTTAASAAFPHRVVKTSTAAIHRRGTFQFRLSTAPKLHATTGFCIVSKAFCSNCIDALTKRLISPKMPFPAKNQELPHLPRRQRGPLVFHSGGAQ